MESERKKTILSTIILFLFILVGNAQEATLPAGARRYESHKCADKLYYARLAGIHLAGNTMWNEPL